MDLHHIFFLGAEMMERYFLSKGEISKEQALEVFKNKINESPKFSKEIDDELIVITEGYWLYSFLDGWLKNLDYLVIQDGKQTSGTIDCSHNLASKEFLLRKLNTKNFVEQEIDLKELYCLNIKEPEEAQKKFIQGFYSKMTDSICERHHLLLTQKGNALDIAPIRDFNELQKRVYLEKVYKINYYDRASKKNYQSLFSTLQTDFYELDFSPSNEFQAFYKLYRRPIISLPKDLLPMYYDLVFDVYLKTQEELKYMQEKELFHKIKKNLQYKDYTKYNDYLLQMIFYFKKKNYLKELSLPTQQLKEELFFEYLTLRYHPDSGLKLAKKIQSGLIDEDYVKMLKFASDLGSSYAKKELYVYYSSPRYYNEYYMKRYS